MKKEIVLYFLFVTFSFSNDLKDYINGEKLFNIKKYKEASIALDKFIISHPYKYEVRDALYLKADSFFYLNNFLDAVSIYEKIDLKYPDSKYRTDIILKTGICYFEIGLEEKSEKLLLNYLSKQKIKQISQDNLLLAYFYVGLLYKNKEKYSLAVAYFEQALDKLKKNERTNDIILSKIYFNLGTIYTKNIPNQKLAYKYLYEYTRYASVIPSNFKYLLREATIQNINEKDGLLDNAIADIKIDGNDIWIGTWTSGLFRYSKSLGKIDNSFLKEAQIRDIYVDINYIYLCTYDGIIIYDKKNNKFNNLENTNNNNFSMAQKVIKDDKYIYFSILSQGVLKYNILNGEQVLLNQTSFLKSNLIYSLVADHRYLIFGSIDEGVIIYDKTTKDINYLNSTQLGDNNIKSLLIDGNFLWIGTHQAGISKYNFTNKTVIHLDWKIPYITTLKKRYHEIWIGSSGNGIYIYNQKKDKLENMTVIDGLRSNEIQQVEITDENILIGYVDAGIDILYKPLNY